MLRKKKINLAQPIIGKSEKRAVMKVLRSGNLAQGPEVAKLEHGFSKFVGERECVAVNSGTSALITALLALEIGPGDEVIVPSFTFAATANSVALVGAKPVFVDIDPITFNIDATKIENVITSKTRAIQVVHLYGLPCDMHSINKIAKHYGLLVVEDAAQAHLAAIDGTPVGTFGDAAAFSFYPTKNMTTGEGGMVVLKDSSLARKARLIRNQGMEHRYKNEIPGYNFRMSEIHAAIGVHQLNKIEKWTDLRVENAALFDSKILHVGKPVTPSGYKHVFHQYTISIPLHRDSLANHLSHVGIGSAVYYPTQVHKLPSFSEKLDLPHTHEATMRVLSIPVHPKLSRRDILEISGHINSFMDNL